MKFTIARVIIQLTLVGGVSVDTAAAAPVAAAQDTHAKLFDLFKQSDDTELALDPLGAIDRGDMRFAAHFGDYLSDAYYAEKRKSAERDLAALTQIDRSNLNPTDQLAYDSFKWQRAENLRGLQPDLVSLTQVEPINHFTGYHTSYATLSSGHGGAPFRTVADYENALKRHREFARYLDAAIARFKQGEKEGVVDTKLTVRNMIEQLDAQLKLPPRQSPYFGPVKEFPSSISGADRARLTGEYAAAIRTEIYPALTRFRNFLRDEYLGRAREGVGLLYMKGGDRLYRYLIEKETTEKLSPQEVHQLGLDEVARITRQMEEIKQQVGFKGSLKQFFDFARTSPKFQPKSAEQLQQDFYGIKRKVEARVPQYFALVPKAPLVIRPYDPFRAKFEAGASYEQGTPDGSRPGTFYFNTYDLPSRSTWEETTLFMHEAEPGHHFQISLAQENKALPNFMRFGGNTAYVEGWALYAESLGYPMGMYTDPYQRFGNLSDEMLRAMRLVIDTGIHAKGWTRDQSIQYMLDHSGESRTDATAEVERYIAWPAQALGYKIGQLTITRLRDKAKAALGPKFDIREFHAQVLDTGALPLPILEEKIDRWIESKKAA
jgi:uncharacterized protein (DUF885 family)